MTTTNKPRILSVPNLLSLSRLVGVPLLYPLADMSNPMPFIIWFSLLGLTDFLDGKIARAWNQTSKLGSLLDSIADLAYYLSAAFFIVTKFPQYLQPNLSFFIAFFVFLAVSMLVPVMKFGKLYFIHTFLVRLNGVLVYFLIVLSFLTDTTLFIRGILFIYYVAYIEIISMFLFFGEADPDTRTIYTLIYARFMEKKANI